MRLNLKMWCAALAITCTMGAVTAPLAQAQEFVPHGTLVYCSEGAPTGFDPLQETSGTSLDASAMAIYNRLLAFKPGSTELMPSLATSYDVSKDGLTYTFHLRHGVKWQTRPWFTPTRDFNADDVLFTLDRLMNKNAPFNKAYSVSFPYWDYMGLGAIIKSVTKTDDYTVVFQLNKPFAPFLADLAMSFMSIESAEYAQQLLQAGKASQINQLPVGTGPFELVRYQVNTAIRYTANPTYWAQNIKSRAALVKNLIFAITKDTQVRTQKLLSGECQVMAYPSPQEVPRLQANPQLKVLTGAGYNVSYLYYDTGHSGPLANPLVRRALDMAIDRKALIQSVFGGLAQEQSNFVPNTQWGYDSSIQNYPYDLKAAKALLAKAGYPNGFSTTIWAMPVARPYNPNGRLMATVLQADWAKIGVNVKVVTYDWGTYLKRSQDPSHTGIVQLGWVGDNGDPDDWFAALFNCSGNVSNWCNKDYQALIEKAATTTNHQQRLAMYQQAQKMLHDLLPASPLATSTVYLPMSKNVQGYVLSPFGLHEFAGVSLGH